mmetsp:Transcript_31176/g.75377  ORF Transcript_31176/g.75377 Transcript_31176/m.75377 type:complete len:93 (-) Transcript_31176:650-928(-)
MFAIVCAFNDDDANGNKSDSYPSGFGHHSFTKYSGSNHTQSQFETRYHHFSNGRIDVNKRGPSQRGVQQIEYCRNSRFCIEWNRVYPFYSFL